MGYSQFCRTETGFESLQNVMYAFVARCHTGLQNRWSGFDSLRACKGSYPRLQRVEGSTDLQGRGGMHRQYRPPSMKHLRVVLVATLVERPAHGAG